MTIKSKLLLSFSLLLFLCMFLSFLNYYISKKFSNSILQINYYNNIINNSYIIQKNAINFTFLFSKLSNPLNTNREIIYTDIQESRTQYLNSLDLILKSFNHSLIDNLNQNITNWRNFNISIIELSKLIDIEKDNNSKDNLFIQFNTQLINNIHYQNNTLESLDNLINHLNNEINTITTNTNSQVKVLELISFILIIFILIISIIFIYFIIKSITSTIKTSVLELTEQSDDIFNLSNQLSESSLLLSNISTEQAASIEETSASLEQISSMVKQNNNNVGQTTLVMEDAFKKLNASYDSIKLLTTNINIINNSSQEIFKIVKIIDDISFQINLLSLNASVEAARAGEAGNGFSVVANEVRSLSNRSANSSNEISKLIKKIVNDITTSNDLIQEVNTSFLKVFDNAEQVNNLITQINESSKEQTIGIEQINSAVIEIDKTIQHISSSAEETSSSSIDLKDKVTTLKYIVENLNNL